MGKANTMRKKNALLGTVFGVAYQILSIFLSFAVRTVFLKNLSVDYLGVNALFSDIFGILIALDCGVSSSVFLRIYKPLAQEDTERVKSVFALIRLVYRVRALAVFVVGGVIYFFLPVLAKSETVPLDYIKKSYVVYLILIAINYSIIFYTFFLETIQKRYILVCIQGTVQIIQSVMSIICLFRFKSFIAYIAINALAEIVKGIVSRSVGLKYLPYLKGKLRIKKEDSKDFVSLIGLAFHSMSNVVIRYTDSLLIVSFAGLTVNGIYSNYKMITEKISSLINQMTSSVKDPMRNLMAEGDKNKVKETIDKVNFIYFWISGFCAISLFVLINPFISIIWGDEYLLGYLPIAFTVINIYLPIMNYTINDAYYYSECYRKDKRTPIIEIVINLIISVVLGRMIGLTGILIGTVACYAFQAVRRAYRFYHKYLSESVMPYVERYLEYFFVISLAAIVTFMCSKMKICENDYLDFLIKCFECVLIPNLIFFILYFRTVRFQYVTSMIHSEKMRIVGRIKGNSENKNNL